jgi:hypothetical protein
MYNDTKSRYSYYYTYFTMSFKHQFWFWEFLTVIRNFSLEWLAMRFLNSEEKHTNYKFILYLCVYFIAAIAIQILQPYRFPELNNLEVQSLTLACIYLLFALLLKNKVWYGVAYVLNKSMPIIFDLYFIWFLYKFWYPYGGYILVR